MGNPLIVKMPQHKLEMVREDDETTELLCPECEYHIVVRWEPLERDVLVEGGGSKFGHVYDPVDALDEMIALTVIGPEEVFA